MSTGNAEPTGWRPDEGAILEGEVVALDKGWSDYTDSFYPIVTLKDESGELVNVHCFHAVLKKRMMAVEPGPGDKLTITYHGKRKSKDGKREVSVYTVESDKPQDAGSFWASMGGAGARNPGRDAVSRATAPEIPIAGMEDDGGDIPF